MTAALVIARMLTEGERAESTSPRTLSGPVYTWSLHAFSLVGQLSDREKTSPPNSKRFRDGFKSDRSNHLCLRRIPDETGHV